MFRDMFHDKVFRHRFFTSHNVPHPVLVAEVEGGKVVKNHTDPSNAPKKLIWKPRYSTTGLWVEHFTTFANEATAILQKTNNHARTQHSSYSRIIAIGSCQLR